MINHGVCRLSLINTHSRNLLLFGNISKKRLFFKPSNVNWSFHRLFYLLLNLFSLLTNPTEVSTKNRVLRFLFFFAFSFCRSHRRKCGAFNKQCKHAFRTFTTRTLILTQIPCDLHSELHSELWCIKTSHINWVSVVLTPVPWDDGELCCSYLPQCHKDL